MIYERLSSLLLCFTELRGRGVGGGGWGHSFEDKWACITKFIVHAHGNNYGPVLSHIPDVIELTCIEKSYFSDGAPALNKFPLPIIGVDFANCSRRHDIDLNVYPFVSKE
jgi:hypothetical protein